MRNYFQTIYLMGHGVTASACADIMERQRITFKFLEAGKTNSPFFFKKLRAKNINPEILDTGKLSELCAVLEPTLILSVNNTFIYPAALLSNKNITIINYHNAILPQHRGMNAEAWAIFDGDEYTGVTWHLVDDGIDTGEIICQKPVKIDNNTTSIGLLQRQSEAAVALFEQNMTSFFANFFTRLPNTGRGNTTLHLKKQIPGNGLLDPSWSNDKIWRFLRAMDYGPYNCLGKPGIRIDGVLFSWKSYMRLPQPIATGKSICLENNNIILNNTFILQQADIIDSKIFC